MVTLSLIANDLIRLWLVNICGVLITTLRYQTDATPWSIQPPDTMKGLELLRIKLSERVLSYGRAGRCRTVPENGQFLAAAEQSTFVAGFRIGALLC